MDLSSKLTENFGQGFSFTNLNQMRQFYVAYSISQTVSDQLTILQTPSEESQIYKTQPRKFALSWSHYLILMKIENKDERSFYEIEAAKENWSVRQLSRQKYEKPTIGILLCETANQTLVKLTLPKNANIYSAQYALYLPDKKLLQNKLKEWIKEFEKNKKLPLNSLHAV